MALLLNGVYLALLAVVSPALFYAAWRHGKYREGWREKLFGLVEPRSGNDPCVWLHAVSLGEVNLLSTIVRQLERSRPDVRIYITTTTKTGYDAARRQYADHHVSYCPLDFSWAVKRALSRIRPDVLILAELEIWPNLIRFTVKSGARVVLINGRLSPKSYRGYRRLKPFLGPVLRKLHLVAVQTSEYARRFIEIGADPDAVVVTGSLKFDGVETDRDNSRTVAMRELAGIRSRQPVWLAGSTFPPEEKIVLKAFHEVLRKHPNLRLILVPRHPERFDAVAQLVQDSGLPWVRRSQLAGGRVDGWKVLLVDAMGELSAWWGAADVAFVGGSMGSRGGQNMIEPAAYGAAVCFGPKTVNFRDVVQSLLQAKGAVVVNDAQALTRFVTQCLDNPSYRVQLGIRAQRLVLQHAGATDRTLAELQFRIPEPKRPLYPGATRKSA